MVVNPKADYQRTILDPQCTKPSMEKHYSKIAEKTDVPSHGVHLVHFVLKNMQAACVFPPSQQNLNEPYFTPGNICAAILAYLKHHHPKDPRGTLKQFGFKSSSQIGQVVKALQENRKTKTVSGLNVDPCDFEGFFSRNSSVQLTSVRWVDELNNRHPKRIAKAYKILNRHFDGVPFDELVVNKRRFPEHVRADLQLALNQIFEGCDDLQLHGLNLKHSHEGIDFRQLTDSSRHFQVKIGPLAYSEINVGPQETVKCLANGLWLAGRDKDTPFAVVLGTGPVYQQSDVQIEYVIRESEHAQGMADSFFEDLQRRVERSKCYRGKILSFEQSDDYQGRVSGVKVHELKHVSREEVILPQKTLALLDRNVIDFAKQRPALKKRGMNVKKGLLFFGPPGTGKTHTVHYLSRALPETTTLIITSEQIGWLSRYMTLARLLQPSLVIIEDADLIARQRNRLGTCEEVLLNKLLNEMDGLRADAEIIFVLTTNRPQALEEALTARPGRIDQAIEFPLPDDAGRRQLAVLYAGNQNLREDAIELIVQKTEHTSAAFIKELMRRATQYAIARGSDLQIETGDIELAIEEMLFSGGAFNRRILGALTDGD